MNALEDRFQQSTMLPNGGIAPDYHTEQISPNSGPPPRGFIVDMASKNLDRHFNTDKNILGVNNRLSAQTDHSGYLNTLSDGIKAKARAFGVNPIVGLHKHQSSFVGGAGLEISRMQPSEILAYHNFLGSLTPQEQHEYENFLGINFKKIGNAIGNAAKAVGHAVGGAATAVAHGVRDAAVGTAHVARSVGLGVAHTARDIGVGAAHVARSVGVGAAHFTRDNWPYLAAVAAIAVGQPEIAAAMLGIAASMKAQGASDQQVDQALADQGLPPMFGDGSAGAYDDSGAYNPDGDEAGMAAPDANGIMHLANGSVYDTNTGLFTDANGKVTHIDLDAMGLPKPAKKTNWLLWGGIAVAVVAIGYYLHKHKKLNFKFLK